MSVSKLGNPNALGVLARVRLTADQSTTSGTAADITGATATVTVLANRLIKITASIAAYQSGTNPTYVSFGVNKDGSNMDVFDYHWAQLDASHRVSIVAVDIAPSAGSHTYKITWRRSAGTGTLNTFHSAVGGLFVVEDIGPS